MDIKDLPQNLADALSRVNHPAINFSLIELGIVKEVSVDKKTVYVTFAFPFPNIPIEGALVGSIANPVKELGYELDHTIVIMTEEEKARFLDLEHKGWKGM